MPSKRVVLAALVLAMGARLSAIENVTLFRVFLNDGTAVVSYGEFARVGDRVVFSMPIGAVNDASYALPNLHVVNIPATAVDWTATSRYAESARFAHYVATNAEADYAALTGDVAAVLNSIMFTKDPEAQLNLAMQARHRLESWPRDHFGYRSDDVRQILGLLDEAISDLRASAGETAFSLELIATLESPVPAPVMADPTPAESIAQALAVAKVSDVAADRVSILRAVVSAIDEPHNAATDDWAKSARRSALSTINQEVATDARYSALTSTMVKRASAAAARADVRGVENVLGAADREDAALGRQRSDVVQALLAQVHVQLDAARRLRLARDQWQERFGGFRAYQSGVAPVVRTLQEAQRSLDDIKKLAGSEPLVLVALSDRLQDSSKSLAVMVVPDELKTAHALLQSALNLADQAVKIRRQAVISADLKSAWDASSAAAGSMILFAKAREDMEATIKIPQIR